MKSDTLFDSESELASRGIYFKSLAVFYGVMPRDDWFSVEFRFTLFTFLGILKSY